MFYFLNADLTNVYSAPQNFVKPLDILPDYADSGMLIS